MIPRLLVLTDRRLAAGPLPAVVAAVVQAGARAVVLREKDLPAAQRAALAEALSEILAAVGGQLIVAGRHGSRVHLSARDPYPTPAPALVGRSCHDAGELAAARAQGCHYVTLSPVYLTASKPGYGPALGPAGLAALIAGAGLVPQTSTGPAGRVEPLRPRVYALGGVLPATVEDCLAAGAHGVAAMGPLMREPHLAADYLARIDVHPPADPSV